MKADRQGGRGAGGAHNKAFYVIGNLLGLKSQYPDNFSSGTCTSPLPCPPFLKSAHIQARNVWLKLNIIIVFCLYKSNMHLALFL